MDACPCGSKLAYDECCRPLINNERPGATAEQVMRARYSAYARAEIGYLLSSLHPDHRSDFDEKSTRSWSESSEWHNLEIVKTEDGGPEDSEGRVEFIASYTEKGVRKDHHEMASFVKKDGIWYFMNGEVVPVKPVVRSAPKTGRNEPCPCGSGKKFKKCCAE